MIQIDSLRLDKVLDVGWIKRKMAIGRVVGVGREFRWPPKENHTKGGMKKLLLCTEYHAHTVPKP